LPYIRLSSHGVYIYIDIDKINCNIYISNNNNDKCPSKIFYNYYLTNSYDLKKIYFSTLSLKIICNNKWENGIQQKDGNYFSTHNTDGDIISCFNFIITTAI